MKNARRREEKMIKDIINIFRLKKRKGHCN